MNDGVALLDRCANGVLVADVADDFLEVCVTIQVSEDIAAEQVEVEHADGVSCCEEFGDEDAADVTGSARDQDPFHRA